MWVRDHKGGREERPRGGKEPVEARRTARKGRRGEPTGESGALPQREGAGKPGALPQGEGTGMPTSIWLRLLMMPPNGKLLRRPRSFGAAWEAFVSTIEPRGVVSRGVVPEP